MYHNIFKDKTVLVSGHTGFKGSWLSIYLKRQGARVVGYSLKPPTVPSLFEMAGLQKHVTTIEADIRDHAHLQSVITDFKPSFIFHLAAQPLVLEGYRNPRETFDVNVMGSVSMLEAIRAAQLPCTVVMVVTDKCYENCEWAYGYRENDALGGHDPYSASKAAMEIVTASYRASYFPIEQINQHGVRIASARAGNVIGGGDWGVNRIVPDAIRALSQGDLIKIRHPQAQRPWQHVLESLSGYLWLAATLALDDGGHYSTAWNFGPMVSEIRPVSELADRLIYYWGNGAWVDANDPQSPHETRILKLSIDKAREELRWEPVWDFETSVQNTVAWYQQAQAASQPEDVYVLCLADLTAYEDAAKKKGLLWTV